MRQGISITMTLAIVSATAASVSDGVRAVVGSDPPSLSTPLDVGPGLEYSNIQNRRPSVSKGCCGRLGTAKRFPFSFVASRSHGCVLKPRCKARHDFFQENIGCNLGRCPPALALPLFSSACGSEDDYGGGDGDGAYSDNTAEGLGLGRRGFESRAKATPMPRMVSWGLTSRSQPSARKALGSSSKTHTIVYVCEVCGSEHVQWIGRCPTCKEWNSVKPFKVRREQQGSGPSRILGRGVSSGIGGVHGGKSDDMEFQGLRGGSFGGGGIGWLPEEGSSIPTRLSDVSEAESEDRLILPGTELPRVFGGGLVRGSMAMLGGDPGVGKSTLLLQLAGQLASSRDGASTRDNTDEGAGSASPFTSVTAARSGTVVYVSGEENNSQVAARAARMGISGVDLYLYCETDVDVIIDQVLAMEPRPIVVMVDSIQTMKTADSASSPGSVTQVKECSSRLVRLAKGTGVTVFIVGHVTKSGTIAGPKVVEHMVDTVLYLEGDRFNSYRLLRSVKNRFGPSNEIGVFQMVSSGLEDVADPSMLFLSSRHADAGEETEKDMDGSAVCVYMEGSRPILCELQSLVTYSRLPSPRRTSDGLPIQRLLLLLAVLQKRLGYDMNFREVYLNIVGGLKVQETAADLAVALAIVSSYATVPVRSDTCFIGEIGLGGELRPVQQLARRIQEAETFGFSRVVVPLTTRKRKASSGDGEGKSSAASVLGSKAPSGRRSIEVVECRTLKDAVAAGLTTSTVPPKKRQRSSNWRASNGREGMEHNDELEFGWQRSKRRTDESLKVPIGRGKTARDYRDEGEVELHGGFGDVEEDEDDVDYDGWEAGDERFFKDDEPI